MVTTLLPKTCNRRDQENSTGGSVVVLSSSTSSGDEDRDETLVWPSTSSAEASRYNRTFIPGQSTQDGIDPAQIVKDQKTKPAIWNDKKHFSITDAARSENKSRTGETACQVPEHTSNEPTLGHATNSLVGNGLGFHNKKTLSSARDFSLPYLFLTVCFSLDSETLNLYSVSS
ncbi:hypothetical protein PGT21_026423 [Puccinia graminis f. sp. tritici]|uniref:Uncharacterized protein n=1 Tax=Puccinia graminis f. sp. tritici TaxID=56615 RepID=A0A5B0R3F8_PUCGR|nr:hypothetical protein PGT21_026423 [Puccinia graminis f. sp. tritici]